MDAGCPFCCPKSRSDCEAETLGKFIYYTWNPPLLSLWTKLLVPINNHSVITRNPTNSASQNQDENQEEGQAENANAENSEPVATCVWIIPQNALLDPRCFVIFPFFYGVPFCKVGSKSNWRHSSRPLLRFRFSHSPLGFYTNTADYETWPLPTSYGICRFT